MSPLAQAAKSAMEEDMPPTHHRKDDVKESEALTEERGEAGGEHEEKGAQQTNELEQIGEQHQTMMHETKKKRKPHNGYEEELIIASINITALGTQGEALAKMEQSMIFIQEHAATKQQFQNWAAKQPHERKWQF